MNLVYFAAVAAALLLGACGGGATPPEASRDVPAKAARPSRQGEAIAEYRESIHPGLPDFRFTLTGAKPSGDTGPARVQAIEIRRDAESDPFQVIGTLNAETPIELPAAFEAIDMNFDGYRDIRLMDSLPAGPNTPYRNWKFNPATGSFEPSPELDAIPAAHYDAASKTIRSSWRDGAARYGHDTYRYIAAKPVLVRREERLYTAPGVYTRTLSERRGNELEVIETTEVRE